MAICVHCKAGADYQQHEGAGTTYGHVQCLNYGDSGAWPPYAPDRKKVTKTRCDCQCKPAKLRHLESCATLGDDKAFCDCGGIPSVKRS